MRQEVSLFKGLHGLLPTIKSHIDLHHNLYCCQGNSQINQITCAVRIYSLKLALHQQLLGCEILIALWCTSVIYFLVPTLQVCPSK